MDKQPNEQPLATSMEIVIVNQARDMLEHIELRERTFIKHLGYVGPEVDEDDFKAVHFNAYIAPPKQCVGTVRVHRISDTEWYGCRICVSNALPKEHAGLGTALIEHAERFVIDNGGTHMSGHGRADAIPFFEKQGYIARPDEGVLMRTVLHFPIRKALNTN